MITIICRLRAEDGEAKPLPTSSMLDSFVDLKVKPSQAERHSVSPPRGRGKSLPLWEVFIFRLDFVFFHRTSAKNKKIFFAYKQELLCADKPAVVASITTFSGSAGLSSVALIFAFATLAAN